MAKTAKQVKVEQEVQPERDRAQLPATRETHLPAMPDNRSPRQQYLDSVAPSGVVGRLISFDGKHGTFIYHDTEEPVSPDEDFIALCDQTVAAWVKFQKDGPPLREGGLLYAPDFALPPRHQLGDNDRTRWELGKYSGEPEDPWQQEMLLVLKRPTTQELLTFSASNKTGRRGVATLLKQYDQLQVGNPGAYYVVRCRPGGYQDSRYGFVHTPNFIVCGTVQGNTPTIPDTSLRNDMDDEIPF